MQAFKNLTKIGEGTYGTVFKGSLANGIGEGTIVALKMFKDSDGSSDRHRDKTTEREATLLQHMNHPNIVLLVDVSKHNKKLTLVTEYVEKTVLNYLEVYRNGLSVVLCKRIMWQALNGLTYLHHQGVVHRDIKPENLLISREGIIKICDFGFARYATEDKAAPSYTDYVATRWYRAPELLLGTGNYDFKVDVWAVGCLLYELLTGKPLFPGDSDMDQLWLILSCFGKLPDSQMSTLKSHPVHSAVKVPSPRHRQPLSTRCQGMPSAIKSFLEAALHPDPMYRATAAELLDHEFFADKETWLTPRFCEAQEQDAEDRSNLAHIFASLRSNSGQRQTEAVRSKATSKSDRSSSSRIVTEYASIPIQARAGPSAADQRGSTIKTQEYLRAVQQKARQVLTRPITHHGATSTSTHSTHGSTATKKTAATNIRTSSSREANNNQQQQRLIKPHTSYASIASTTINSQQRPSPPKNVQRSRSAQQRHGASDMSIISPTASSHHETPNSHHIDGPLVTNSASGTDSDGGAGSPVGSVGQQRPVARRTASRLGVNRGLKDVNNSIGTSDKFSPYLQAAKTNRGPVGQSGNAPSSSPGGKRRTPSRTTSPAPTSGKRASPHRQTSTLQRETENPSLALQAMPIKPLEESPHEPGNEDDVVTYDVTPPAEPFFGHKAQQRKTLLQRLGLRTRKT